MILKRILCFLFLFLLCLLFWFVLVKEHFNIFLGIFVAFVASSLSIHFFGQYFFSINIFNAFFFFLFYLEKSFLAGIDVALRAMSYKMPINPEIVRYNFKYTKGFFKIFFCWAVTLMPGTLSMKYNEDFVIIHILTFKSDIENNLDTLEKKVGEIQKIRG